MRLGKRVIFWVTFVGMMFLPVSKSLAIPDEFCQLGDSPQVKTALGCVPVRFEELVGWLLPFLFGIAGGISFLLMVYGFIVVATSSGDPKRVAGGRETITSALMGLLTSIFALFILRLIAVDILKIPGIN